MANLAYYITLLVAPPLNAFPMSILDFVTKTQEKKKKERIIRTKDKSINVKRPLSCSCTTDIISRIVLQLSSS